MANLRNAEECAAIFKVTVQTIYRWKKLGLLPAAKPGKRLLIADEDVQDLLTKRPKLGAPAKSDRLKQYVDAIVADAPALTPDQVDQLRDALGRRNA